VAFFLLTSARLSKRGVATSEKRPRRKNFERHLDMVFSLSFLQFARAKKKRARRSNVKNATASALFSTTAQLFKAR